MAALFLVIVAALRLWSGGYGDVPASTVSTQELAAYEELLVTGQIYQKDETSVYLKSVFLVKSNAWGQSAGDLPGGNQSREDQSQKIPCQENIICDTEYAGELPLGRTVLLRGVFYPCSPATNPGEFDSAVYYRTLGVGGRLRKVEILALGEDWWPLRDSLYELKCRLKERLYGIFPEKEAAVMSALLLGDKKDLDSELKDLYKRNGILHILSISSLHITIIGMTVYRLLRKIGLPICPSAVGGSVLLLFYGGMTGFSVSACRAIGMYLIRMLAEVAGRTYDMLTALGVMGAAMVIRNPYYLQNSGFLLSFSSVLGIGVVSPVLAPDWLPGAKETGKKADGRKEADKGVSWEAWVGGLAESVSGKAREVLRGLLQSAGASLSIFLATLPIQLRFYYEVPVYSVFLNLFVLPLMKPMMITGLLAMLVPGLGLLGGIDFLILKSYELLCGCFDRLPFRTWNPGCPGIWQIVAYYLLLGGIVAGRIYGKKKEKERGNAAAGLQTGKMGRKFWGSSGKRLGRGSLQIFGLSAAVLLFSLHPPGENSVTLLDVGQGDCILVRTASGENYLFDCGSSSRSGVGRYILIPYLKYCGIQKIDGIFLSHPDADHVNGAVELLEMGRENNITVGQLLLPAIPESAREEQLGELTAAAREASQGGFVPVGYLQAGDGFRCGSADFLCLHPKKSLDVGDINACSECFYVRFREKDGSWSLLLTGDVQNEGEEMLLEELRARDIGGITVLKVAHHGSRNSTPEELLDRISPMLALISSGRNNRYGHPHAELLRRLEESGSKVVQTARSGAVTVTFRQEGMRVVTFIPENNETGDSAGRDN